MDIKMSVQSMIEQANDLIICERKVSTMDIDSLKIAILSLHVSNETDRGIISALEAQIVVLKGALDKTFPGWRKLKWTE